jgi:2,5-furandicarboxylate decarboxylase 1
VMWAIHTRCRPDTGIHILPNLPSFPRDDVKPVHRGKLGVDATYPLAMKEIFRRRRFPGIEAINLADYVAKRAP